MQITEELDSNTKDIQRDCHAATAAVGKRNRLPERDLATGVAH